MLMLRSSDQDDSWLSILVALSIGSWAIMLAAARFFEHFSLYHYRIL